MLAGYLRLKLAEFDAEAGIDLAAVQVFGQSLDAQLGAVARLHRLLMSDSAEDLVDLYPLLHEICAAFENAPEGNGVLVEDLAKDCLVAADQVLPIGQLVAEAIVNARKYALQGVWDGYLIVRSARTLFGGVKIEVIDNGPGLPERFDPERDGGFGFNLMRGIARGLHAPLLFESSPHGLRIGLVLPEPRKNPSTIDPGQTANLARSPT
ncbi:MAG: sensor histidine kinase [Proteobacteria bacterium]|nr:sensor histidine kinase [Pseudomonadota bacterium]